MDGVINSVCRARQELTTFSFSGRSSLWVQVVSSANAQINKDKAQMRPRGGLPSKVKYLTGALNAAAGVLQQDPCASVVFFGLFLQVKM